MSNKRYTLDEITQIEATMDHSTHYIEAVEVGPEQLMYELREFEPVPEIILEEWEKRERLTKILEDIQQVDLLGMEKTDIDTKRAEATSIIERLREIDAEKIEKGL